MPEELTEALEDFEGVAATLRFDDGALELESAGDPARHRAEPADHRHAATTCVATLPDGHRRRVRRRASPRAGSPTILDQVGRRAPAAS